MHSFNSTLFPLLILAIIGAGGISTGTNPSYTKAELSHAVRVGKVKLVFAEPEILSNMLDALKENGIDVGSRVFVLDTQPDQKVPEGRRSWRELLEHGEEDWIRFEDDTSSRDTVAQLYYTSGTTGLPKCTMTTHQNIVAEHQLVYERNPSPHPFKLVLSMPFFHAGINPSIIVSVLKEGREGYVMRRFDLEPYLRLYAKYQLTEFFGVPPMILAVIMSGLADEKSDKYKPEFSLRSVRNGIVGAAPTSPAVQARFQSLLGKGATMGQVWGMSETTSIVSMVPWGIARACGRGEMDSAWGNVGTPNPSMQLKLVDEKGKDVTESGRGELCVRGPTVVKGYYGNEKATKESWDEEGYFHTGDVIEVRRHKDPETGKEEQLMYVVERLKELIKVRGFQVAPAELEGALLEHPEITDAAVIGLPTKGQDDTELPKAFVVRREGSSLTEEAIMAHMKERVARYKQLTGGIEFVESIPKLPSGKILKRILREEAKKKLMQQGGLPKL